MQTIQKSNKETRNLGQTFWKKIEEELRIFTLLEKRPKRELPLYELRPEDVNIDLQKVKQWSEQTETIYNKILENGFADFICNKEFLREVFLELKFNKLHIDQIDKEVLTFKNLKILELNQNCIKTIENIPPQLLELHLFTNQVVSFSSSMKPATNLLFLGLGFNKLNDEQIQIIPKLFPQLVCLDISNNLLEDIQNLLQVVSNISNLKMLNAYGNPICLLPNYKKGLIHALINLEYLDNMKVTKEDRADKIGDDLQQEKNIPDFEENLDEAANNTELQKNFSQQGYFQFSNPKCLKIRFKIDTLENLPEGIILDKTTYPKAEQYPERFQTCYYCVFDLPNGQKIDSREKVLQRMYNIRNQKVQERLQIIQNYEETQKKEQQALLQQQQAAGAKKPPAKPAAGKKDAKFEIPPEIPEINPNLTGKTMSEDICKDDELFRLDMKIDFIEEFPLNLQTKEIIDKGIIIRLYKTEPLMEPISQDNQDDKQPKIDPQTGFPEETVTFIGLFKIDCSKWNLDGNMPKIIQYKYSLFDERLLKVPQFHFPEQDEEKQVKKNAEKIAQLLKEQEDAEKPVEVEITDPKKKDNKKKEVKKVEKKPPQKKTGKEEEKPKVPVSTFPLFNRQQIFVDKENIHLCLRKWILAAHLEIIQ